MKTRVGDIILSKKPNQAGMVLVRRFSDCLLCGPSAEEMRIFAMYDSNNRLVKRDFCKPYHESKTKRR